MAAKSQKILGFKGLVAPTFTAFLEDGTVNTDIIPKYADHLLANGVKGIFLNGTTGESVSLSVPERKCSLEKWIGAAKDKLLIIVQVGANCILEAKELAEHAEKQGADAIAVIPPIYYRPNNEGELIRYLSQISAAAPNTPLMYYHIPKLTGVNVSLNTFLPKAKEEIPNLCGAKYTSTDLQDLVLCQKKFSDQFKLMLGSDELMLAVLPYGVNAFIGISYNMFANLGSEIIESYTEKDMDSALLAQNKLATLFEEALKQGSLIPVLKICMNMLTNIKTGDPRCPLFPLEKSKEEGVKEALASLGY